MAKVLSHEEIIQILKQFDEKWEIEDNGKKLKKEWLACVKYPNLIQHDHSSLKKTMKLPQ